MKALLAIVIEVVLEKLTKAIIAGIAAYKKTQAKISKIKKVKAENKVKVENYENANADTAHDEFSKLP